jgi:hypothetical protein
MNKLLEEFFTNISRKKNRVNLRNLVNIVNPIVSLRHAIKWDLHRKRLVDLTKIVINNLLCNALLLHFHIFILYEKNRQTYKKRI